MASTLCTTTFSSALSRFQSTLNRNQKEQFASCTEKDLIQAIQQIQAEHGSRRRVRNMRKISRFVEAMSQLGQVVEVFLNVESTVAFIWGPVKLILLTASTWMDSLDLLLETYGEIGEVLPDLSRYSELYKEYPQIQKHLESYYCDILEFHRAALDVFSRSTWKQLFHAAWKTFKTKFGPILNSLKQHRYLLSDAKLTAVMEEVHSLRAETGDAIEALAKDTQIILQRDYARETADLEEYRQRKIKLIFDKLDVARYEADHDFASEQRFSPSSGDWILSHPSFQEWADTGIIQSKKIYLNGIPGAGKTILSSRVIDYIKQLRNEAYGSGRSIRLAYFYFKRHQPEKRGLIAMLSALSFQLLYQDNALLEHFYSTCCGAEQQKMSHETISKLATIALDSPEHTFIIIDGLDECVQEEETISWLENFMNREAGSNCSPVHLFISGQRDGILECRLSDFLFIRLDDTRSHDSDIQAYVLKGAHEISRQFGIGIDVETDLVNRVMASAHGMFLYAKVVLGNLMFQTSVHSLKQELLAGNFPQGLQEAYERIAQRVLVDAPSPKKNVSNNILAWIICSPRPLHLREIQSRFCIDPGNGQCNLDRRLVQSCKQLCSSLVDIRYHKDEDPDPSNEDATIDMVHITCGSYLRKSGLIDPSLEHARLALFCSQYLQSKPFHAGITPERIEEFASTGYYGFHDYAGAYWYCHAVEFLRVRSSLSPEFAEQCLRSLSGLLHDYGELDMTGLERIEDLDKVALTLSSIPNEPRERKSNELFAIRFMAIRSALENALVLSESKRIEIPFYGRVRYRCAMSWCGFFSVGFQKAQERDEHIKQHTLPFNCGAPGCTANILGFRSAEALKRHDEKWHNHDLEPKFPRPRRLNDKQRLLDAAAGGDLPAIIEFIENTPPGKRIVAPSRLMYAAAKKGHMAMCEFLLANGARADVRFDRGAQATTALHSAITRADIDLVDLCLQYGSKDGRVNLVCDGEDRNPIDLALKMGNVEIISRLLARTDASQLNRVLRLAIMDESVEMVRLYVKEFRDVDLNHLDGDTALSLATETRNTTLVKLLLSGGQVDPNRRGKSGRLPLHEACLGGMFSIVQLLAPITTANDALLLGFQYALQGGREDIADWMLKEFRVTIDQDKCLRTPLHYACKNGSLSMVQELISRAPESMDVQDSFGETPLQLAVANRNFESTICLLEAGASYNRSDYNDRSIWDYLAMQKSARSLDLVVRHLEPKSSYPYGAPTPLHFAAYWGNVVLLRLLIATGQYDVNALFLSNRRYYLRPGAIRGIPNTPLMLALVVQGAGDKDENRNSVAEEMSHILLDTGLIVFSPDAYTNILLCCSIIELRNPSVLWKMIIHGFQIPWLLLEIDDALALANILNFIPDIVDCLSDKEMAIISRSFTRMLRQQPFSITELLKLDVRSSYMFSEFTTYIAVNMFGIETTQSLSNLSAIESIGDQDLFDILIAGLTDIDLEQIPSLLGIILESSAIPAYGLV